MLWSRKILLTSYQTRRRSQLKSSVQKAYCKSLDEIDIAESHFQITTKANLILMLVYRNGRVTQGLFYEGMCRKVSIRSNQFESVRIIFKDARKECNKCHGKSY